MNKNEKQVAQRRINFLKRVITVQELYQNYYVEGLPTTVIWRKHIEPIHHISLQTLREYLSIAAKSELSKITNNIQS